MDTSEKILEHEQRLMNHDLLLKEGTNAMSKLNHKLQGNQKELYIDELIHRYKPTGSL